MVVGGGWCKPIIGYNSNSTLGGVELTWSGDGVEMELGVELELGNNVMSLLCPYCVLLVSVSVITFCVSVSTLVTKVTQCPFPV